MMNKVRYGICCIILSLEEKDPPKKFQRMTYKKFSQTPRQEAIKILSSRILNNIDVTFNAIKYCEKNNYCYRLSSDLFPLLTYDKADLSIEELPDYQKILSLFEEIKIFNFDNKVRISLHPGEFNVLASKDKDAVGRTIKELNFYSWFMDKIGCPANYNCPINIHINNNQDSCDQIIDRLLLSFDKLHENCRNRIVIENDDKLKCWSVKKLLDYYHKKTGKPITFDYLHYLCHPDGMSEEDAFRSCYESWGSYRPIFHYSESKDEKNIRAHADYPKRYPNLYCGNFDLDFEFKMKEKAVEKFKSFYT